MCADRSTPEMTRLARWGLWLVAGTLAYNVVEAVVALWAGSEAGSIALLGFGLDSVIEVVAASALLWRLSVEARGGDPERIEKAEGKVRRLIGLTFLVLAAYVTVQAVYTLTTQSRPEESLVGIVLAAASLIIMPLLAWGKLRVARGLGERGTACRGQRDPRLRLSLTSPSFSACC